MYILTNYHYCSPHQITWYSIVSCHKSETVTNNEVSVLMYLLDLVPWNRCSTIVCWSWTQLKNLGFSPKFLLSCFLLVCIVALPYRGKVPQPLKKRTYQSHPTTVSLAAWGWMCKTISRGGGTATFRGNERWRCSDAQKNIFPASWLLASTRC